MDNNGLSDSERRKQQVSGVFDRAAVMYDHVGPRFFSHFGRRLVELAHIPEGANVLDVATGRGAVLIPAAEAVGAQGHVIGVDLSEKMALETAKELDRLGLSSNAEARQMDAEALQFPDQSFDFVLCCFAIFFFPQLGRAMSEFRRVLKPNGRVVVATWDKAFDEHLAWFDEIVKTYLPPEPEESKPAESDSASQPVFDTLEGLEAIMKNAGFADIQIVYEAAEFAYANEEEYWSTLWSHGGRVALEAIEKTTGAEGLQRFKADVFARLRSMKQTDGIHQTFPVLFALATEPRG
ncbi:MAG: methyltransferase domain-containing protein [Chloroflexi bacterium]|jgi:ubiquinone/menaquinone biosynthesis C-methylase UbiE|nr:methyltransferase domain-containing protein [Chloroflexota bacterium]